MKDWLNKLHLVLFSLVLFSYSWGQLGRISFWEQRINLYGYEVVLTISLLFLAICYGVKPIIEGTKKYIALYCFLGYTLVNFCFYVFNFSILNNFVAFSYLVRFIVYAGYGLYFSYYLSEVKKYQKTSIVLLQILGVIIFIASWLQYLLYPNLRNIAYLGWDPHLYRMVGTFLEPPVAGSIYGIYLCLAFFILFPKNKVKALFAVGILAVMIFFTYARGIYVAFIITTLIYLAKKSKPKTILLFVVGVVAIIFLIPKPFGEGVNLLRTSTIQSRLVDYEQGISVFADNFILGVGYNRIREFKEPSITSYAGIPLYSHSGASYHSSLLTIAVTLGIFGLILFIWWIGEVMRKNEISLYLSAFLLLVSLFDNMLLQPFILFLFLLLIPLSYLYDK